VARRILRSHGGDLTLASPGGEGRGGAVFVLRLPVHDLSEGEEPAGGDGVEAEAGSGSFVVVHEDDPSVQRLIRRAARRLGFQPVMVDDRSLLVEIADKSRESVALAVLDSCSLADPDNDVARLREVNAALPILLISASESAAGVAETPWGVVEKLPKPFSLQALSEAMTRTSGGPQSPTAHTP
jgi:ActR/RegA family two-component response regulator